MPDPVRRHWLLAAVVMVLLTAAAYAPAVNAGFIWDDDNYVTHTDNERTLGDLGAIWTNLTATPQYYPLTHTVLWGEYHLWRFEPRGYHCVNIALHGVSACLIALAMLRLGWARAPAWAVGALFALHPIGVESVAWVTELKNVLCGFFCLLTFHGLISHYRLDMPEGFLTLPRGTGRGDMEQSLGAPPRFRWGLYALIVLLFLCTLWSKTVGSVLPAAMVVLLWWKGRPLNVRTLLPLVPLLAIGAGMGRITSWLETTNVGAAGRDWEISLLDRVLIAGRVVWFYAGKWVWPEPLNFMYPRWTVDHTQAWQYAFPVAAAAVLVVLWALREKIGRGPLAAVLIYLGCLLPASGFFNIYPQRFSFVADHFSYLATLALSALVVGTAWSLGDVMRSRGVLSERAVGAAMFVLLVLVLAVMGTLTFQRAEVFKSDQSLWEDTYRKDPDGMLQIISMAGFAEKRGDLDGALTLLKKAVEVRHGHAMAYSVLATFYQRHGDIPAAIDAHQKAIANHAGTVRARGALHQSFGVLLMSQNRPDEAAEQFTLAIECWPEDLLSKLYLSEILRRQEQWERAAKLARGAGI